MKKTSFSICTLILFFMYSCNQEGCSPTTTNPEIDKPSCSNLKRDTIDGWMEEGIDCGGPCISCAVDSEKELIITSNKVVDNEAAKTGKLSFGYVMTQLAGSKEKGGLLAKSLFDNWSTRTVSFTVPNTNSNAPDRVRVDSFLNAWKDLDESDKSIEEWIPNLDNAPFRLLAITNRIDLKDTINNSSGEGRFTYCIKPELFPNDPSAFFNIIFEYNLPGRTSNDCGRWVNKWHSLSDTTLTNTEYINTLTSVTDSFLLMNDLNQLRTNDFIFEKIWELREFKHNKDTNSFDPHFLSKTPDIRFDASIALSQEVIQLETELRSNLNYEFSDSLKAASAVPRTAPANARNRPGFTWTIPETSSNLEFMASLNSCNGCHMGHGDNAGLSFMHIRPRLESENVRISRRLNITDRNFRIANMNRLLGIDSSVAIQQLRTMSSDTIISISDFIDRHVSGH